MDIPPQSLLDFRGKVVLVTGSSSGIGAGIAYRFAEAGADVAVHYRDNKAGAMGVVSRILEIGRRSFGIHGNLVQIADVERMLQDVQKNLGGLDILVNNAGVYPVSPLIEISLDEWKQVVDIDLASVFLMTQAATRRMIETGEGGVIVNIASIEAVNPTPNHSHYCAAKAGLLMLTRTAAGELGQYGIRVNSVSPGLIWKEGIEQSWPEGVNRWMKAAPLKRLGMPQDVADACLFLASPAARWITGVDLVVDGGVMTGQVY